MECARVGVLYRGKGQIQSLRISHGKNIGEELAGLASLNQVEEWMEERKERQEDTSYLAYFYRCLEEQVEFYYLYEAGKGWRVGCTMRELPLRGKLVGLEEWLHWEAVEAVEAVEI